MANAVECFITLFDLLCLQPVLITVHNIIFYAYGSVLGNCYASPTCSSPSSSSVSNTKMAWILRFSTGGMSM